MKGFACLCVVLGHVVDGYLKGNIYPEANRILFTIFNIIYAFHMPFFMMISGYVYSVAYFGGEMKPERMRIYRQIGNIIIVYVLFSVLFGLTKIAFGGYTNDSVSLQDICNIWRNPISPYWYLYDLVLLYLLFTLSIFCKGSPWIMGICLMITSLVSHYITFNWFQISSVLYYMWFFYIGFSKKSHPGWMIENKKITWGAAVVSIALSVLLWKPYNNYESAIFLHAIPVGNMLIATGISLILWYLFQNVRWLSENQILRLIGRHCLEIYVLHCFFTAGFRTALAILGVSNPYVSMVLNFLLSTGIPLAAGLVCKKLGIYDLIFRPVSFWIKQRK